MSDDESRASANQAGTNGHAHAMLAQQEALSATAADLECSIVDEVRAIDDDLATLARVRRDGTISVDDLVNQCVQVWSRIRHLEQRLATERC